MQEIERDTSVEVRPSFDAFVAGPGMNLRRALVARYGHEVGLDLHADALERAWRDWDRIETMANPAGYLWRAAQSSHRRYRRWSRSSPFPGDDVLAAPDVVERDLFLSLGTLRDEERVAVVLVHAHRAAVRGRQCSGTAQEGHPASGWATDLTVDHEIPTVILNGLARSGEDVGRSWIGGARLALDNNAPGHRSALGVSRYQLAIDGVAHVGLHLLLERTDLFVGTGPGAISDDVELDN